MGGFTIIFKLFTVFDEIFNHFSIIDSCSKMKGSSSIKICFVNLCTVLKRKFHYIRVPTYEREMKNSWLL